MGCSFKCVKRGEHAVKEIVRLFIFYELQRRTTFELAINITGKSVRRNLGSVAIILCESTSRTEEIVDLLQLQ